MISKPMEPENSSGSPNNSEARLDEMFRAYRYSLLDPDLNPRTMPAMWARIEAREVSTNWFGRVAKALVTAALAASVILGNT